MKAVVLVGGEGTRMRPLTETTPKPLLPFMNRPFLHHVLDHLARHGVTEVILSSPFLEREFDRFLRDRDPVPTVTWITEERPLGTCGAVVGALPLLDGTFLVLNGDILTDLDLTELAAWHRSRGAVATIALATVADARAFGLVETDGHGRVRAFREKPAEPGPGRINAGTYVLEPEALAGVAAGVPVSIERETYPDLIARGEPVYAMAWDGYWRDLGTPEAYLQAHLDALRGRVGGVASPRPLLAEGSVMGGTAAVGELVVAGRHAAIGPGARVDRSVLHEGATVGAGATVVDSVLGPHSRVGPGATLRTAVLGERAVAPEGSDLAGVRVPAGEMADSPRSG